MKFKIRFADQIVGFFIIVSLVSLAFVIVMLGRTQRWFAKDLSFSTVMPSAVGLSKNMAVQYKGFTIGSGKGWDFTANDDVEVTFTIQDIYADRVKKGSMVDLLVSPVGLGNQFIFYTGKGDPLPEGSSLPVLGSAQAMELIRQGFALEPQRDDSITLLMSKADSFLKELNILLALMNEALGPGTDNTEIGQIIGSIQTTLSSVEDIPVTLDRMIIGIQAQLNPILANANALIRELNEPDGLLYSVMDTDKEVYTNLVKSLVSVSGILEGLDKTVAFIPGQLPQIAALFMDLRVTLATVEDVLIALANNPLLKGGVPDRLETQASNSNPRGIRF
jgi:phospholipid/cholesterol/gamma-HCH transport system substrate-binding protein